jgi:3-oxoacyl-[acyl-carrier-protein] synthase II
MFISDIAAGLVSIRYGAKGPNYCTVSACASSAHALGNAFRSIKWDEADLMIAGRHGGDRFRADRSPASRR